MSRPDLPPLKPCLCGAQVREYGYWTVKKKPFAIECDERGCRYKSPRFDNDGREAAYLWHNAGSKT